MKKILSILIVAVFICASFFVFATEVGAFVGTPGDEDAPALTPIFSFVPIITTFDLPVTIPDTQLNAALHSSTGIPSGDAIYKSDLAALTGNLNYNNRGIEDLQGIQYCSNITGLFLDDNNISSVLTNMSGLANLQTLWLSGNNFTTVPQELCTIPNLEELKMNDNPITSVTLDLGCTSLDRLYLNGCNLSSFDPHLNDNGLKHLELGGNNIGSLPGSIENMTSLTWLDVENCGLSALPSEFYNMNWLERLYASDNSISSLSSSIGGMTSLEWLVMRDNGLGSIPSEICTLSNLSNLILDKNEIYSLPSNIGNTNIVELSAPFNNISTIPSSIGNAASLEVLDLMLNRLTELPSTFDDIDYDIVNLDFNFIDLSPGSPGRTLIDNATIWTAYIDRQMMPVTNLVATPTDTEVTLTWDACQDDSHSGATWDVDSYAVYTYDGSLHKLADLTPAELTYTHTGLAPNTTVEYRVRVNYHVLYSLHGINEMARCYTKLSATTLTEAPATPTPSDPSASPAGDASLETPSDDADGNIAADDNADAEASAAQDDGIPLPQKDNSFPVWAIVLLSILGGALAVGGVFLVRFLKSRPKTPKGGGDRTIEL